MARMAIGADEKKKLMVLGAIVLVLIPVVGVLYFPRGGASSGNTPTDPALPSAATPAAPPAGGAPGAGAPVDPGAAAPAAAPGGITAASLISVERYRNDPFEPFPLPPPLPTPPPPAPPPPPVMIPPPVEIVPPGQAGSDGGFPLPPMGIPGAGSRPLANLPPIVPRRVASAPTAPRFFAPPGGQSSGGGGVLQSQNKRLSGVIIGDSVRALLEVTSGGTTTTRVVQPGDEVDGIRILRLERVTEAGRTITRLVVRENNQEQFVELRPAPQQAMGEGGLGMGGIPGMPGMPGGLPPGMAPF